MPFGPWPGGGGGGGGVTSWNGAVGEVFFPLATREWFADGLIVPNASWAIPAPAPTEQDNTSPLRSIVSLASAPESGRGFATVIPPNAFTLRMRRCYKPETAPGAARTVGGKLYWTTAKDNVAVPAWASTVISDITIEANTNPQFIEEDIPLSDLTGAAAGGEIWFEVTRIAPTAGTDLTGDAHLSSIYIEWRVNEE
jgi:hypothetical protein